jgi:N-acetylglucosaminyldiphosphoundecaprenol N-acetyl-beta-D-mannosaminyltransferase
VTNLQDSLPQFNLLGVRVHALQIPEVVAWMEAAIADRSRCRFLSATGMHGVTEAQHDPQFKEILNAADLVVPDGMPLVWAARHHRFPLRRRVYGPELTETFCRETGAKYRHFFYGGASGVPEHLAEVLHERYGVRVAGCYSPPFRPLTGAEEITVREMIESAAPDVLWVGLSTPKQERWMHAHRHALAVPLLRGVGAAFDFHTGRVKQAPAWMRENGLEWLFRLVQEPRRLWRRYLIYGSQFAWNVSLELIGLKKF